MMDYDTQAIFQNLARYNQRANREMYEILSILTDKARKIDRGVWFGSLHGILNHLIITDLNWLKRFRVLSPESSVLKDPLLDPPNLSWEHDLHENFKDLRNTREIVDARIRDWFSEFSKDRYPEVFQYQDSRGNPRQAKAGAAFEFLFLHQTHHRGQVAQILDAVGLPNDFANNINYLECSEE
jgi:uncharacterized damage-inducible protein DinB